MVYSRISVDCSRCGRSRPCHKLISSIIRDREAILFTCGEDFTMHNRKQQNNTQNVATRIVHSRGDPLWSPGLVVVRSGGRPLWWSSALVVVRSGGRPL